MEFDSSKPTMRDTVDAVYRSESRRILATLIRLLGDFDLAEEALHDAFTAAMEQWPRDGVPANPRTWLVSAGRFKAIDRMRRRARFDASLGELAERLELEARRVAGARRRGRRGGRRRSAAAGLHLLPSGADARRADRADAARSLRPDDRRDRARLSQHARRRSRSASSAPRARSATRGSPIRCRRAPICRIGSTACCTSIYLVFNEGYAASSGESLTRHDLSAEAIRLGRLLVELLPEPEAMGLLALMLLHESRRAARASAERGAGPARRSGPLAVGPRADRRRDRAGRARAVVAALRSRTRCRRRSPRSTPRRQRRRRPTGGRSSGSTTSSSAPIRRRSSSSTAPRPSRCATARPPASR